MRDLPKYKNRIIIATLLYFPAVYIGYYATIDTIVPAMIYHVLRAIGFYIIMYHYYKFYRIKYRGDSGATGDSPWASYFEKKRGKKL